MVTTPPNLKKITEANARKFTVSLIFPLSARRLLELSSSARVQWSNLILLRTVSNLQCYCACIKNTLFEIEKTRVVIGAV